MNSWIYMAGGPRQSRQSNEDMLQEDSCSVYTRQSIESIPRQPYLSEDRLLPRDSDIEDSEDDEDLDRLFDPSIVAALEHSGIFSTLTSKIGQPTPKNIPSSVRVDGTKEDEYILRHGGPSVSARGGSAALASERGDSTLPNFEVDFTQEGTLPYPHYIQTGLSKTQGSIADENIHSADAASVASGTSYRTHFSSLWRGLSMSSHGTRSFAPMRRESFDTNEEDVEEGSLTSIHDGTGGVGSLTPKGGTERGLIKCGNSEGRPGAKFYRLIICIAAPILVMAVVVAVVAAVPANTKNEVDTLVPSLSPLMTRSPTLGPSSLQPPPFLDVSASPTLLPSSAPTMKQTPPTSFDLPSLAPSRLPPSRQPSQQPSRSPTTPRPSPAPTRDPDGCVYLLPIFC